MINQRSIVDRLRHSAAVNRDGEEAADEIERLMRERDEAKTDAQKAHTHAVAECQDNDRLRAALERYAGHEDDCEGIAGLMDPRCTCGLTAALSSERAQSEPESPK